VYVFVATFEVYKCPKNFVFLFTKEENLSVSVLESVYIHEEIGSLMQSQIMPQSSQFTSINSYNSKQEYWSVLTKFLPLCKFRFSDKAKDNWRSKISNLLSLSDLANLQDVFGYSISIYGASSSMNLRLERC